MQCPAIQAQATLVSSVNVYSSEQILKARLMAAVAYESAFRHFALESTSTEIQSSFALNLISKGNDAMETYRFLRKIKERVYNNAVVASGKASATFDKNIDDVKALQAAFEKGIQVYKKDQEMEAAKGIIKAVIGAAVAVGAIVATAGAAAPVALPAAAGAISAASKVAKIKQVFEKLKAIYKKLEPVIKKIKEVVKLVSDLIAAVQKIAKLTSGLETLKPNSQSSDVHNVTAEWRNFDITVREMEDSLREYSIDGKQPYFHALKTLVNNGEALINTQVSLVKCGDELATTILQQQMEDRNIGRLEKISGKVTSDKNTIDLIKRAMYDRLLTVRVFVFQDFVTYNSAFNFHSLRKSQQCPRNPRLSQLTGAPMAGRQYCDTLAREASRRLPRGCCQAAGCSGVVWIYHLHTVEEVLTLDIMRLRVAASACRRLCPRRAGHLFRVATKQHMARI